MRMNLSRNKTVLRALISSLGGTASLADVGLESTLAQRIMYSDAYSPERCGEVPLIM